MNGTGREQQIEFVIPGQRLLPIVVALWGAFLVFGAVYGCWQHGVLVVTCLVLSVTAAVAISLVQMWTPVRTLFNTETRICTIPHGLFRTQKAILFDRIASVNVLLGQESAWQTAWLCLAVKGRERHVVIVRTRRWGATATQLETIYKQDAERLAELIGCPVHVILSAHPDMSRRSLEKHRGLPRYEE